MATIAMALALPLHDRLALGCWTEDIAAELNSASTAASSMAIHYADEDTKVSQQIHARQAVMTALQQAWRDLPDDELPTALWSGSLASLLRNSRSSPAAATDAAACSLNTDSVVPVDAMTELNIPAAVELVRDSDNSDSASSSASSSSSSSSPDPIVLDSVEWCIVPSTRTARLHRVHPTKVSSEGYVRPRCGTIHKEPVLGSGVAAAAAKFPLATWCAKCALDILEAANDQPEQPVA